MAGSYNTVINLFIGELSFLNCTDNMMSIDHVRVAEAVSSSTVIEVYDDTALVVDAAIASNEGGKIQFEYGYSGGAMSERYEATITKYGTDFQGFGALCTIECVSTGVVAAALENDTAVNKKYSGSISDIVYQVASEEGWSVGKIETTDISDIFEVTRGEESASDFIGTLIPKAVSAESGKGGYKFRLAEDNGTTYVFFARSVEDTNESEELNPYDYQYTLGMPNEKVISFNPQYNEVLTALIGASVVKGTAVDPETNEQVEVEVTSEGSVSLGVNFNTVRRVAGNSYTQSELTAMAKSLFEAASMLSYNATLVIKGQPRINPNTKVSILVLTREGQKHHSSGSYLVLSVEDLVENGTYTTTLELMKNSSSETTVVESSAQVVVASNGNGSFIPRTTAPSTDDANWRHTSVGGKNQCINISGGSVLPNCVGYAWGRFMEILGSTPKLSTGNAEDWWSYNDGYERGQTPQVGAVACWRKGAAGNSSDGAGHVAIVEKVNADGSFLVSESGYGGTYRWGTRTIQPPKYSYGSAYTFQGFIYNPVVGGASGVTASDLDAKVQKYLGTPYVWGGESWDEGGFDCSGFAWHFLKYQCGSTAIGDRTTAAEQAKRGTAVTYDSSYSKMKPGDLCFKADSSGKITHVVVYMGNGKIVHAPQTGDVIKYDNLYFTPCAVRRYI